MELWIQDGGLPNSFEDFLLLVCLTTSKKQIKTTTVKTYIYLLKTLPCLINRLKESTEARDDDITQMFWFF